MTVILVNRFFHPDHSATSQMASDLAVHLASAGFRVRVVASRLEYGTARRALAHHDLHEGVEILRVWTTALGTTSLAGRALDYASFAAAAAWTLLLHARPGDVIVAMTDPPMLSVAAAPIARLRGARLVNWLQDIFPETAEALAPGRGALRRAGFGLLRRLRDRSLTSARMTVVLGERMAARVGDSVAADRLRIIPNWTDGRVVKPVAPAHNTLRRAWGLEDRLVVGYAGNLGRAHDYKTLLAAMVVLDARRAPAAASGADPARAMGEDGTIGIAWLLIGGGVHFDALRREVERLGLPDVRFEPYQARSRLAESLSAADIHLVSLRPELEGLVVPSKIYGIAAAGRPAIFIGDPEGEIGTLLARFDCGISVAQGDAEALAREIRKLAADPGRRARLGSNARGMLESEFDLSIAARRWVDLLEQVTHPSPG